MAYLNTQSLQYHLTEMDIRRAHPNTSFPEVFVPPANYVWVFPVPMPSHDPVTSVVTMGAPELTYLGSYQETWLVKPKYTDYTDVQGVLHTAASQLAKVIADSVVAYKEHSIAAIDEAVNSIMRSCIGERATEYQRAEAQARAYKSVSYTGVVPSSVAGWAAAKSWTSKQAADDIIIQADTWIDAQDTMRAARLKAKVDVKTAVTIAGVNLVMTPWNVFIAGMRTQLGV